MRQTYFIATIAAISTLGIVDAAAAKTALSEEAAIFRAAGLHKIGRQWTTGCDSSGSASYAPGSIEQVGDLNGDKLPEAVVTEGSAFCYGMTGQSFWLVSKQASGVWKMIASDVGIPEFLKTRGKGGWPDILIGGPGFCFPVHRWNGVHYLPHRNEYEGKPCRPPR